MFRNGLIVALIALGSSAAFAQAPGVEAPPGYNGLQAGEDAAHYNNALRASDVAGQLQLSRWTSARQYSPLDGFYFPYPAPLGAAGPWDPDLVDPWPLSYASPWGPRPWDRVRQSVGQRYRQTGPNRWESLPIYPDQPLAPASPVTPPPRIQRGQEF